MKDRIPSLDGFRALAIGSVILLHISQHFEWPAPGSRWQALLGGRAGAVWTGDGVGIFFVLSGFLITSLLLREYERTRSIRIGDFYARRAFRILPPLLVYLLWVVVFCSIEKIPFHWQAISSAVFFYRDYYFGPEFWATEHTWSLSVEEQFYLLWPVAILLLLRYRGRSAAAKLALVLIAITPLTRSLGYLLHIPAFAHREISMLHARIDALMCGCCLALCIGLSSFEAFYRKIEKVWWLLPLQFWVGSLLLGDVFGILYRKSIGMTIDAIAMAFFILWATRNPDHWVGRILNSRVFVQVGILSYSAYLWQTFFIHHNNRTFLGVMPFSLVSIWVMAWLSYRFVEQPSLHLRNVVMKRKSAGHAKDCLAAVEVLQVGTVPDRNLVKVD